VRAPNDASSRTGEDAHQTDEISLEMNHSGVRSCGNPHHVHLDHLCPANRRSRRSPEMRAGREAGAQALRPARASGMAAEMDDSGVRSGGNPHHVDLGRPVPSINAKKGVVLTHDGENHSLISGLMSAVSYSPTP
jgi:hypothetical protein